MDPQASDRKLCVSLSSAPEVTARRHTDHATICRFADCIFFRVSGQTSGVFVFRTVGRRQRIGDNFLRPRGNCPSEGARSLQNRRPIKPGELDYSPNAALLSTSSANFTNSPRINDGICVACSLVHASRSCIHILMTTL